MSRALPYSWLDERLGAPSLLSWLRLALGAAGRKVLGAFPWIPVLCPVWVLVRHAGRAIFSPVYLILLCSNVIVAGILLFEFDSEHKELRSAGVYLLVCLGLVAGLASFLEICMRRSH